MLPGASPGFPGALLSRGASGRIGLWLPRDYGGFRQGWAQPLSGGIHSIECFMQMKAASGAIRGKCRQPLAGLEVPAGALMGPHEGSYGGPQGVSYGAPTGGPYRGLLWGLH